MSQQGGFPPYIIVDVLSSFIKYRKLKFTSRGLNPNTETLVYNNDRVINDMEQFSYVRLDAIRDVPRGIRDWVVILILSATGKYSLHSPDLRKLLEGVEAERPTKEGRLDEVIIIAEEAFFGKKNLTDVIREAQQKQSGGPDLSGENAFYNAYPYYNFALIVPNHTSVALHQIMTVAEVDAFLTQERITRNDLAIIFTSDAPLVWIGAREGQVVKITRDSQTAGISIYYRRVEYALCTIK